VVERLPGLECLQLSAPGALSWRPPSEKDDVGQPDGARLLGEPRLCEQAEDLSLEFPGMSEAELAALLEPVRDVAALSLRRSAVGDGFVRRVAERFDLRRLDVRDTQVSANCLRDLRAAHPRLRTVPRPPST